MHPSSRPFWLVFASLLVIAGTAGADCPPGDITGDCIVDFLDVQALAEQWLEGADGPADIVGEGDGVDMADFAALAGDWGGRNIVINEIHSNPDVKTQLVEFVELYNAETRPVDISGWFFSNGIAYTFPQGTTIDPNECIIVAQNVDAINQKWGWGRGWRPELVYGPFDGKLSNEGERVTLCDENGYEVDEVDYALGFPWPTVGDPFPNSSVGAGRSIQLINPRIDNDLGASWRSSLPSPTYFNKSIYTENSPPHIRQVKHSPKQPRSGQTVTITAKVTDPDGVAHVTLFYQIVEPGGYSTLSDTEYYADRTELPMLDDGLAGDVTAGDDIYTVRLPGELHLHRHLVRFWINVVDTTGRMLLVPYTDDPQPNFAYFVYDGVPAWSGSVRPGVEPVIEYPAEVMGSLPVYHLISKKSDVEQCNWFYQPGHTSPEASEFNWYGTLVYDGEVYDHVRYRLRGGTWRQAMGKNMWKFDFNRGHYFQARDDYGEKYKTKWNRLNFSACIQQGSFGQRGEQGMFEALSFRMFQLAGVPASKTNYLHFRVIDEPHEDGTLNAAHQPLTGGGTQYDGDFWGLYMTIEQMDGIFLDEHKLPDGNLYKMDSSAGNSKNNQGPTQPADQSDLNQFMGRYRSGSEQWWRDNVNLDVYYAYYAIYHAVHHGDISGKNWFMYHHPETDRWWQLPWDVDLTWTTYYCGQCQGAHNPTDPFSRAGVLGHTPINIECRNRVREICDLLFNSDQMNRLIDEYAAIIDDPNGGLSLAKADRAMWDYHWVMHDSACGQYRNKCGSNKAGQGRFYQATTNYEFENDAGEYETLPETFQGMTQLMKHYLSRRMRHWRGNGWEYYEPRLEHMQSIAYDSRIPNTPLVASTTPAGYPINALTFQTSPFSDPQGNHTFAAMKWRIAEITTDPATPDPIQGYLFVNAAANWKYFKGTEEPSPLAGQWRDPDFSDAGWLQGGLPIGFGEPFLTTTLTDMKYNYTTLYLRKDFDVLDADDIISLKLEAIYDDGFNVWINGHHVLSENVTSAELPYDATAYRGREIQGEYAEFDLPDPHGYLVSGVNVIAIQLLNARSTSSDCFIDIRLLGQSGGEPPVTPPTYQRQPGKYEIEAVWQSEELETFDESIQIPASAVRPGRTYRVRCRMKDNTNRWSHWSAPAQFVAGDPLSAGIIEDLRITELMYNPADPPSGPIDNDEFEFVELKNIGDDTLDLTYVAFTNGLNFGFGAGKLTSLGPGEFVLVVKNEQAFISRYGIALADRIAGVYPNKLSNGGERIKLVDLYNGTIADFEYNDSRGWPGAADGAGHSLVPLPHAIRSQPDGPLNYCRNWRQSAYIGGSPGADDPDLETTVVINEFMAHTDYRDPLHPQHESNDWVELYNASPASVNLENYYLSDDRDELDKWPIPAIALAHYGRISFDEITGFHASLAQGFGLNKAGEELVLSHLPGTSEDRVVDYVRFKGQENFVSLGRYPDAADYWFTMNPSRAGANLTPLPHIVISELMYHPIDTYYEYIELHNPLAVPVTLINVVGPWRLDGAVSFTFPTGTSILAGGRLIVVPFNPYTEPAALDAFVAAYNTGPLTPGVDIVGPWSGNLSNETERLAIERPQAPDTVGDSISWVIVDELIYSDSAPWPTAADGTGKALHRTTTAPENSANDPANWQASASTPGRD